MVGQIRRANAWVRRAHQFADMKLTFLCKPPEKLRFDTHTDHSSKYQDGTGRKQGGYIIGATDPSMGAGVMALWSSLVWKSHKLKQGCTSTLTSEAKALSLGYSSGMDHAFLLLFFSQHSVWKTGRSTYSDSQPSASSTARSVFDFVTKPGAPSGIDGKRCAIDMAGASDGGEGLFSGDRRACCSETR